MRLLPTVSRSSLPHPTRRRPSRRLPADLVDDALEEAVWPLLYLLSKHHDLPELWDRYLAGQAWRLARAAARRRQLWTADPAVLATLAAAAGAEGEEGMRLDAERFAALVEEAQALLTERQGAIFSHLCAGLSQREIADLLGLTPATVAVHAEKIRTRLGTRFDWLLW